MQTTFSFTYFTLGARKDLRNKTRNKNVQGREWGGRLLDTQE